MADNKTTAQETAASTLTGAELVRGVQGGLNVRILVSQILAPRVIEITSHATPTINTGICDAVTITALAENITSMTTNLSASPASVNFQQLLFRIKDDGTSRTISWGAAFASRGATLPTVTTISKVLLVLFIWNSVTSTWDCTSIAEEA